MWKVRHFDLLKISRRFFRRDFFITKILLLCNFLLALDLPLCKTDFASGEHHHGTAPTGRGPGKVPGSKPNKYRARQAASGTARERMLIEGEGAAGKQATAGKRLEQIRL
jgi:hypothetical protein